MNSIKNIFLKYRSKIIVVVSLLLIALALVQLYFVLVVRVTSNDECLWIPKKVSADSVAIFFDIVKVEGVTWEAGIRNGDQLIAINGENLHSTWQATQILSALFWMIIGFIVLTAKPDGRIHRLFYFLGVLSVLTSLSVHLPMFGDFYDNAILAILIGSLWLTGMCFIPFMINYFFWNFPVPFKFVEKAWVKKTVFLFPALLSVLVISLVVMALNNIISEKVFYPVIQSLNYFVLAANFTAWIALIIQYRRIKTKENKKPVLLMLIALTFGFAVTIYTAQIAPVIADTLYNSPEYFAPIILVAIVPLIFAYSIFKYQLMDVSVVVKNTIIYGTATVTVAAIYFLVVYVLGQSISSALGAENQGIVAGVFFIIFALIFQSTKNKFQDFLTKRFYPEQFAHQKVLVNLSNELATVVGLENILKLMKTSFVDALKIDTFGILLRDNSEELKLVEGVGINDKECVITESKIPQFLKEKSLITKYPSIEQTDFKSVFPDENAERLLGDGIHTIIPMVVKSKPVGLLLFGLKHSGSCFAGKDLELLWAAANQAAVSIENSRLYKTEVEKQKIERDLDLARKIQQGLLPACIPEIRNLDICGEMIPAMQVGGDYFDLLPVDGSDSKLFVVIGDVSGKGLSASLYMTKLQTMMQLFCTPGKTPKEILVDVNKRMYDEIERNWFITITLALFDLDEGTVKFCRAGHMPILTANNGTVEAYRTQGIGVGLEKGEIFERSLVEEKLKLNSGQIYAFFTDGVTEAMNEANELFGEDKLTAILKNKSAHRSTEIMEEILHSLKTFRGTAEVNDDITMVIVKVK
jgi:serine phosphatase RsbU (regulator of sigma subunit)